VSQTAPTPQMQKQSALLISYRTSNIIILYSNIAVIEWCVHSFTPFQIGGKSGGWSTAAYMAANEATTALSTATPINLVWMEFNRTDVMEMVPCVRSSCVASNTPHEL
jgi:hypothetical protein